MPETNEVRMLDIATVKGDIVEIDFGKTPVGLDVLYININGICRFRLINHAGVEIISNLDKQSG